MQNAVESEATDSDTVWSFKYTRSFCHKMIFSLHVKIHHGGRWVKKQWPVQDSGCF